MSATRERTYALIQPWYCVRCGARGEMTHDPRDHCTEIMALIDAQHAAAMPHCGATFGASGVYLTRRKTAGDL